jgi:hypothetical protein
MDPYQTYYRELSRSLENSPRLLIIGYGFSDYHINSLLRRFTRWHGDERRAAVVDFVSEYRWRELLHDPELFVEGAEVIERLSKTVTLFDGQQYANPWRSPDKRCVYYPSGIEAFVQQADEVVGFLDG